MENYELVQDIRAFNRLYMPKMNLLGNHYLGSEYTLPEARVLYEIYKNEGCNASHISRAMNLDKSYLSRILKGHEKKGYLKRKQSKEDRRSYDLYLTDEGKKRAQDFIEKSDQEIGEIIKDLTGEERDRLSRSIKEIMDILAKG